MGTLWSNSKSPARLPVDNVVISYNLSQMASTSSPRLAELDGLRGLAALTVFFSHTVGLFPGHDSFVVQKTPLHILWDGNAAVMFFFLLSGYVLALPFVDARRRKIRPVGFIVKRLFRLYPAYWCALTMALFLRALVLQHYHLDLVSSWAQGLWQIPLDYRLILHQFLMLVPNITTQGIDPVIWSLVIEMKISLIFPAFIFLVQRTTRRRYALLILMGLAVVSPLLRSFMFLPIFVAGSYLAKYRDGIQPWIQSRNTAFKVLALVCGLGLYGLTTMLSLNDRWNAANLITAFGAAILLLLSLNWLPLSRFTTSMPVHFLGDVSYSFYLLHLPILLTVTSLFYPSWRSILLCALCALILSLIVSRLMYDWVEMPMIRHGRNLANLLQTRGGEPALEARTTSTE